MKARELAVYILDEILYKGAYSNLILSKSLSSSSLNPQDKALTTEIVYGTLKYKYSIDKNIQLYLTKDISALEGHIANILRISFYQLIYLSKIPEYAIVNEAVDMSKKSLPGLHKLVNGVLRNYLRNKLEYKPKDNLEYLCYKYSFEPWMVKLFLKQYTLEETEKILGGLNENPNVTVRVNSLKIDYQDAYDMLLENGYEIEMGNICPEAIHIIKGKSIESNPLFREGLITVQDESAMLVAPLVEPSDTDLILDLCAAPGGKTTHIAELLQGKGRLCAFDIYDQKLKLIRSNANRLGVNNIELNVMDASKINPVYINEADKILADLPCSGIGIIRKKPEIKWNKNLKSFKELIAIQREILDNAIKYLKEDGLLVYSTCTLNKQENEENIKWLLKKYPFMKLIPIYLGNTDNIIYHKDGYITVLPNEYMDGFFIAKLIKTSGC